MTSPSDLKAEILRLTREYSRQVHGGFRPAADPQRLPWQEGSTIPYAGRVFTEDEVEAAVSSTLDFWLTLGSEGAAFERELAGNRLTSLSGCSGTGAGFCRYDYRRGGQRLEVITVAGPDGNGLVLRWSEAPRLSR